MQRHGKKKRTGCKSLKRAAAWSEKAASRHIGELAEVLIKEGILNKPVKIESGVWTGKIDSTRVMNNLETPQFINFGLNGTANLAGTAWDD